MLSSPRGAAPRAGGEIQRSIPCSSISRRQRLPQLLPAVEVPRQLVVRHRLPATDQLGRPGRVEVLEAGEPVAMHLRRLGGDDPVVPLDDLREVRQGGDGHDLEPRVRQPVAHLAEVDQPLPGGARQVRPLGDAQTGPSPRFAGAPVARRARPPPAPRRPRRG